MPKKPDKRLTPNQVVAWNLRRARQLRGWTQDEAAARLEPYLGERWSKAIFSSRNALAKRARVGFVSSPPTTSPRWLPRSIQPFRSSSRRR